MPSTCRPIHVGGELQDGHPCVRVLELMDVAEVAAGPEHVFGRFKDFEDGVASRIGAVDHGAAEDSILVEQLR